MLRSQIDIEKIKANLLKKHEQIIIEKQQEKAQVILKLGALTDLWQKYGIDRVYLYGSFVDLTFHKYSDIDIAIEPAIDFEDLLKLYSEINKQIKREVDIRNLSELSFAEKIKNEGILIYERKNSCLKK